MSMRYILTVAMSLSLIECSTSPTGRHRVTAMSASKMDQMGFQAFEDIKSKTPASTDAAKIRVSQCAVKAILERNGLRPQEWETVVFRDSSVNAFALPGKKIGIHEGIFQAAQNADQLAAVIGHEVGHVLAEHGNERVSNQLALSVITEGALILVNSNTQEGRKVMAALGAGLFILPFSRTHELEADLIGIRMAAKAGFDPSQGVQLWRNMSAKAGKGPPKWLSTHPTSDDRIEQIQKELPRLTVSEPRTHCN